jgi:hypothetical protein
VLLVVGSSSGSSILARTLPPSLAPIMILNMSLCGWLRLFAAALAPIWAPALRYGPEKTNGRNQLDFSKCYFNFALQVFQY